MNTRRSISFVIIIAAFAMWVAIAAVSSSTTINALAPHPQQVTFENDTNRGGSDYRNFEVQANPAICRDECAKDPTCRAFTYVKPGVQGANARCWLKNSVPPASANTCCVSGMKSEAASSGGLEVDVNRKGSDYRHYDLPSNNPNQCRDDCMNDPRCKSFTYVRPSYWGPNAHCWLKDGVPAATQEGCCISGVKGGGGGDSGGGGGGDAGKLKGRWDFVCCSDQYNGWIVFEETQGNKFTGWMYKEHEKIAGEINGNRVTFRRNVSGGDWDVTMTLDGNTLTGTFTGPSPSNLDKNIRATKH